MYIKSKLSDFPAVNNVDASQFSGGDKPHPYLFGETLFVVAGFIPACKGAECRKNRSIKVKVVTLSLSEYVSKNTIFTNPVLGRGFRF
jgi:hypothetical protein